MHYIGVVEQEGDNFGIWFPDFPGCISAAGSLEEVIDEGREALALHTDEMVKDGEALPKPSHLRAVMDILEFRQAENATVVLVPVVKVLGKAVRVGLSIDEGALAAIDAEARKRGLTRSAFIVA